MGVVERDQISDIRPPKKSNIRYHAFAKIRYLALKNQISDPKKNQLSDITPPKKIKYLISRYPPFHPPPPLIYTVSTEYDIRRNYMTALSRTYFISQLFSYELCLHKPLTLLGFIQSGLLINWNKIVLLS